MAASKVASKIVLVTGATAGIGRETALHLARLGHRVFATGRKVDVLAELEKEAGELPLETFPLDVTDADSIAAAREAVQERTDGYGLDMLVNNAGFGFMAPMEIVTGDDMRVQFATNVFGLVEVTQAFLPQMRARGAGKVVNVSSVAGRIALPMQGVYCATKHAVEALTDALRAEVRSFGVYVSLVEPGPIRTNFETTVTSTVDKYHALDEAYAPAAASYLNVTGKSYKSAPGPACIAKTVARILRKRRPGARYVSPRMNILGIWLMGLFPTRLKDWVARKLLKLTPAHMLPSGK
jgi:NAD(P)-dependent dehydrogenase (short-subunit alcohol dehydrogenase family)